MRRNHELLKLLLLEAEGEEPRPDLTRFSERELVHHAAYLVKHGYLDGSISADGEGIADSVTSSGLTESGYNYLERLKLESASVKNTLLDMNLDFFVSHSSKDEKLAGAIARLLQLAFNLPTDRIRCTSVPGFKLACGADTDEQLRQEVHGCKVLVGILTLTSTSAPYVLFELGARWGAGKPLAPLLAGGADSAALPGPLKGKNALAATKKEDLIQFLDNVGAVIGLSPKSVGSFLDVLDQVTALASSASIGVVMPTPDAGDIPLLIKGWVREHQDRLSKTGIVRFQEVADDIGVDCRAVAINLERCLEGSGFVIVLKSVGVAELKRPPMTAESVPMRRSSRIDGVL